MIAQGYSLNSLTVEPKLIAKCLLNNDTRITFRNALALCCTSKVYQYIISSDPFFKDFVKLIDPQHPLFILMKQFQVKTTQDNIIEKKTSFKHKYFDLRNTFLQKNETFPGAFFATAFVSEDGIEIISFTDKIISFWLKENSLPQSIRIPEAMQIPPRQFYRESPYTARTEKFLAINHRCDSAIYIYTPDGKTCSAKYEVEGEICQLTIEGDLLCIVEQQPDGTRHLVTFNLETSQEQPIRISLPKNEKLWPPPRPIFFGNEYLIYTKNLSQDNQIYALPLSCLSTDSLTLPWIEGTATNEYRYIFPKEDHFIEVAFNDCYTCNISKVIFKQGESLKIAIAKGIVIANDDNALRTDVCLHNDRLFLAYDNMFNATKLFSYDFVSGKVAELISISQSSSNHPFKPRSLKLATNIYYLFMGLGRNTYHIQSHLTTLTYGIV